MRFLFKMVLAPVSLFVAFLALMAKWLLTLSSYVVAPLMLADFKAHMEAILGEGRCHVLSIRPEGGAVL